MPSQNAVLEIKIIDGAGKERVPGLDDQLFVNGTAVTYTAGQGFLQALSSGDMVLVVKYKGFAELTQGFSVKESGQALLCSPYWQGTDVNPGDLTKKREGYLLECMKLLPISGKSTATGGQVLYQLEITLHLTREYVALIGADYYDCEGRLAYGSGGYTLLPKTPATPKDPHKSSLPFRASAHTYAQHLYFSGVLNVSSPATFLDCEEGTAITWFRARKGTTSLGYKPLSVVAQRNAARWSTPTAFIHWLNSPRAAAQYITGHDAHSYLDNAGKTRPGTIQNYSVFSHAWYGGPIFFNTSSSDPADFDLRQESFEQPLPGTPSQMASLYPQLPAALAADAEIHVWGCFATSLLKAMVLFVRSNPAGTTKRFSHGDNAIVGLPASCAREDVIDFLNKIMDEDSYMSRFARFSGRKTYGGPPGWGADVGKYDDVKGISLDLKSKISGSIMYINLAQNPGVEQTLQRIELGSRTFDAFKYMCYMP